MSKERRMKDRREGITAQKILFSFGFIRKTSLVVRLRARLFFLAFAAIFQSRRLHIWTKPNVNTLRLTLSGRGKMGKW